MGWRGGRTSGRSRKLSRTVVQGSGTPRTVDVVYGKAGPYFPKAFPSTGCWGRGERVG